MLAEWRGKISAPFFFEQATKKKEQSTQNKKNELPLVEQSCFHVKLIITHFIF